MKLNVHDIVEEPKRLVFAEPIGHLGGDLVHDHVRDYDFPEDARVELDCYRAGAELFLRGRVAGRVVGHCARCLEDYGFALATEFAMVLVPESWRGRDRDEGDLVDLDYYASEELDLSPLICERVVLALPTRPLCAETCRGLCPGCGANLNVDVCTCPPPDPDPRLAALRTVARRR